MFEFSHYNNTLACHEINRDVHDSNIFYHCLENYFLLNIHQNILQLKDDITSHF